MDDITRKLAIKAYSCLLTPTCVTFPGCEDYFVEMSIGSNYYWGEREREREKKKGQFIPVSKTVSAKKVRLGQVNVGMCFTPEIPFPIF